MYREFFCRLWPPNFERNPNQDAKSEAASIPNIANTSGFVRTNNKSHQQRLGVWELFWRIYQIETTRVFRFETNSKLEKTPTSKPPQKYNNGNCEKENSSNPRQKSFRVWEHFWRIDQNETASISKQATNSISEYVRWVHQNEITSISKQETHNIWEHFWWTRQNETASLSNKQKPRTIWEHFGQRNRNETASISKLKPRSIWEQFLPIHTNETASISKQETYSKLGKAQSSKPPQKNISRKSVKENSSKPPQKKFVVWEHFWQIHQIERVTDTIPRPESNTNHGRTKNSRPQKDRPGIWEHIQGMSHPWNAKSGEHARKVELKQPEVVDSEFSMPPFTPYMAKLPWHRGPRAFLSQLFPRYGNYCGPNWSSGKDRGGLLWNKKPIDWLDYCCYCHDMGYDTHDQAEMLKADIAFLECLEKTQMKTKGNPLIAEAYITMCITGLRNILIPYRKQLLKPMQAQHILASKISGLKSRNKGVQHQ